VVAAAVHGIIRVLVVWQRQGERAAVGVPWHFGVAAFQCPHGNVVGASVMGSEGGCGSRSAAAFSGARNPCGGRVLRHCPGGVFEVELVGGGSGEGGWPRQWWACRGVVRAAAVQRPPPTPSSTG
jgi:hypothetical protein